MEREDIFFKVFGFISTDTEGPGAVSRPETSLGHFTGGSPLEGNGVETKVFSFPRGAEEVLSILAMVFVL